MYDFAKGLGLKKAEAWIHVVKAREFCGEEPCNSDSSTFDGEIDDSRFILETLSASNLNESAAVSMAIDLPARQVDGSDETQAALDSPTNSRAASKSAGTKSSSKKRKAKAGGTDSDCEANSALARRRMRKASRSYEGTLELSELSDKVVAQQAGDWLDKGKVAREGLKSESRRQKRLEVIKDDNVEPGGDKDYLNECANSHEHGTKEGSRRSEKKGRYPSLNIPLKPKPYIGQHDDQLIAEETIRPRKGRKRRKHRIDELPADAILSSGDGNMKNSTHRHPRSRDTTFGETRAKLSMDFTRPMIQLA